jgi:hypothetical protein
VIGTATDSVILRPLLVFATSHILRKIGIATEGQLHVREQSWLSLKIISRCSVGI